MGISLINHMAVLIVVAYVLTRTKLYSEVIIEKKITLKNGVILSLIFGLFSIYGTLSGIRIFDATANIRDLGPAIAGLIAGPLVGVGAGLIGAVHRFFLGGVTGVPCAVATLFAGLFGGIIFLVRKKKIITITGAIIFAVLLELFHMELAYFWSLHTGKISQTFGIIKKVIIPMIFANGVGIAIFIFIARNLVKERRIEAEKSKIEHELRIAHDIQMGIIPKIFPPFPDRSEFDLFAIIEPAKEVGGDLYDFFFLDDNHMCFYVGDVSGKGVPASLFMAVSKTLIKAHAQSGMSSADILHQVNNMLCEENESCMFVTVFLGILNIETGEINYSNAGHNIPYIIHNDGSITKIQNTKGIALGVLEDFQFETKSTFLKKDEQMFIFTDGVNEAINIKNEQFSLSRLEKIISECNKCTPKTTSMRIIDEVYSFQGDAVQFDDIAILVLHYRV
ncbi:MAG TPA: serine/threonine protein phosphatase [Candidatus Cloacimonetes bacterium]|nr:serine/threonine protein phosphatase [Candidatus Cloacimonadota bacterium]